ncbi:helix-turn-helix domain-containing protein [Demequina sp. B12]|uniref:helix-turn-helix transcriptional regulator n=1 Tax=Demequina sp. B12 TaxID=2992757 RepID=UPI00237A2FB8|nr:helix-turn-helix domain-containing protein [Demequina sp. B12]MDE0573240.1 helix-turn-helix domain-containing protein [Demequina sp. B12]
MTTDTTRDRVLGLIASAGPITASTLADELGVTAAGVRRHLSALIADGLIEDHEPPGQHARGRGRPAKSYVATTEGQRSLTSAYSTVAVDAVAFMREHGNLDAFVEAKAAELEGLLEGAVPADAPMEKRVELMAAVLAEQGYATSVRPGPGGFTVQLCQGHCPVQSIAEEAPEWCEAETRAFSRVLDVHVQRLSTLAGGAHVCTTTIPVAPAALKEG